MIKVIYIITGVGMAILTLISASSISSFLFAEGSDNMLEATSSSHIQFILILLYMGSLFFYKKIPKKTINLLLIFVVLLWWFSGRKIGVMAYPEQSILSGWFCVQTENIRISNNPDNLNPDNILITPMSIWRMNIKSIEIDKFIFIGPFVWDETINLFRKYHYDMKSFTYESTPENPVKYIDPTGMDGEVSEVKNTGTKKDPHVTTIRAEYYYDKNEVTGEFLDGLNNSIAEYNNLKSTKGNEKDGTYTVIRYNLSAKGFDTLDEAYEARENSYFENSNGNNNVSRYGNIVRVGQGAVNPDPAGTSTMGDDNGLTVKLYGNVIEHANSKSNISIAKLAQYVFGHEIGHNLGAKHGDASPMGAEMGIIPFKKAGCYGGEGCIERWDVNNDNKSISKNLAPKLIGRIGNPVERQYLYYKKQ